jgi:hypothetical protein
MSDPTYAAVRDAINKTIANSEEYLFTLAVVRKYCQTLGYTIYTGDGALVHDAKTDDFLNEFLTFHEAIAWVFEQVKTDE